MLLQPPLPTRYSAYSDLDLADRIDCRRRDLGDRLVILGHHYQQDDVIRHADFTGDSLKLSQLAAAQTQAEFVVFCGVHFMAESADMLTDASVSVILPDLTAGCSMADMADIEQVEDAWVRLTRSTDQPIIPITYVNSTAAIKAFVGEHGGACCTSSNARPILEWALAKGGKVMFMPDQHLGRNTAYAMGTPLDRMCVYDPAEPGGGLTDRQISEASIILWKGHCSVHLMFTPQQCESLRKSDPDCRIIVHPECSWEVVQRSDLSGSTECIIRTVEESPPGSQWAIGTEINLVKRLADAHPDKTVKSLSPVQCLCSTMYRIDPRNLLWTLDELFAGRVVNRILVDDQTRQSAVVALDRMLSMVAAVPAGRRVIGRHAPSQSE